MLRHLLIASSIIFSAKAQLFCSGPAVGPCIGGMCPPVATCVNADTECCPNSLVTNVTTTTTTTRRPTTTAKTTCVDLLNPKTGVSDCPRRANLCNDAVYYDLMTKQCPKTCGRCTSSGGGTSPTCVDKINPSTGVSDCPRMASYCNNSQYYTLMTDQCPRTCGRCSGSGTAPAPVPSTACVDKVNLATGISDCSRMAAYCNNAAYYTLMTQECPRTCGRCSSG